MRNNVSCAPNKDLFIFPNLLNIGDLILTIMSSSHMMFHACMLIYFPIIIEIRLCTCLVSILCMEHFLHSLRAQCMVVYVCESVRIAKSLMIYDFLLWIVS